MSSYERAGAVTTGSFALEKPTDAEVARREKMKKEGWRGLVGNQNAVCQPATHTVERLKTHFPRWDDSGPVVRE